MNTKKPAASKWATQFDRAATAGRTESVESEVEPSVAQPVVVQAQRVARGPHKRPVTYRFVDADLDLVDAAVAAAAAMGERLTKEEAVAQAIRQTYGHLAR